MQEGKRFKVVVADARPHLEGKVLRQRLIERGIACTYILLNGLACVIRVRQNPLLCSSCAELRCPHTMPL